MTGGLAAIAGRDTRGGAAGSIAIWLLRVGQPKESDWVGQHGRCDDARERVSVTPRPQHMDRVHHVNLAGN